MKKRVFSTILTVAFCLALWPASTQPGFALDDADEQPAEASDTELCTEPTRRNYETVYEQAEEVLGKPAEETGEEQVEEPAEESGEEPAEETGEEADPEGEAVPATDGSAIADSGVCGSTLVWSLTDDGVLTISGDGAMTDYKSNSAPWSSHQKEITGVIFDGEITHIGNYAFYRCGNLKTVKVPDGVRDIGNYAFGKCWELVGVELPEGVTSIGDFAFNADAKLESIVLPNSMESFGYGVFTHCEGLTSITIPDGVTTLPSSLFACCRALASVTIPESVTSIGYDVFRGCGSLCSINIPDGVAEIGAYAFSETGLTSFNFPKALTTVSNYMLFQCESLEEVVIPEGIATIGKGAFAYCENLERVSFPHSLVTVKDGAFEGTPWLAEQGDFVIAGSTLTRYTGTAEHVVIPNEVTSIGGGAFSGCDSITAIYMPEGVTEIGSYAFFRCSNLREIIIPRNVSSIGLRAFSECFALEQITVVHENEHYTSLDGVLFNKNMTELEAYPMARKGAYDIPEGVERIGHLAFYQCPNLTAVTIPASMTVISDYSFAECSGIESVSIQKYVIDIGVRAFYGCSSLKTIDLPQGLQYIRTSAFSQCTALESITLPLGMYSPAEYAFAGCDHLREVYFGGTNNDWNDLQIGEHNDPLRAAEIHFSEIVEIHRHNYSSHVSREATCEEDGEITYTCSICGKQFINYIRSDGHDIGRVCPKVGTERVVGNREFYTCSKCGKFFADEVGQHEIDLETVLLESDTGHLPGDVDDSGDITVSDAARLLRFIDDLHSDINAKQADVNEDGFISIADAVFLVQTLCGDPSINVFSGVYPVEKGQQHTHAWCRCIDYHEATGQYCVKIKGNESVERTRTVTDAEKVEEWIPGYHQCPRCGEKFDTADEAALHSEICCSGWLDITGRSVWHYEEYEVQETYTEDRTVYELVWQVQQNAYGERLLVCSLCGETHTDVIEMTPGQTN